MGFGGAGPLHANAIGKLMQSWPVIIPLSPGVLCAYGDATTRMRIETARSFNKRQVQTSDKEIAEILAQMQIEVAEELIQEGVDRSEHEFSYEIDVRYHGQAFEVPLVVNLADFEAGEGLETLISNFDAEHERLFTFNLDAGHELVNLRVIVKGRAIEILPEKIPEGTDDPAEAKLRDHQVYIEGQWHDAVIYERAKLKSGNKIHGPAIVTEMDSTTVILNNHIADIDQFGNILINPA
jgi:N-methylhydantoinase A